MKYRIEAHVDPPLGDVPMDAHDFVEIVATSESERSLQWFMDYVRDRIVCAFQIESVEN